VSGGRNEQAIWRRIRQIRSDAQQLKVRVPEWRFLRPQDYERIDEAIEALQLVRETRK
jgi:hypothetical protein